MELQRQMGLPGSQRRPRWSARSGKGSYGTAWAWLHKIRRAMVVPGRKPLSDRVEADETLVGGRRPGRPGRGASGKTVVAGAVESRRGRAPGRRLGRLRLQAVRDASASSLVGFLGRNVSSPAQVATDGWSGYRGLEAEGYVHEPIPLAGSWGDAALRLPGDPPRLRARQTLAPGHPPRGGQRQARYLDEYVFRLYGALGVKL